MFLLRVDGINRCAYIRKDEIKDWKKFVRILEAYEFEVSEHDDDIKFKKPIALSKIIVFAGQLVEFVNQSSDILGYK